MGPKRLLRPFAVSCLLTGFVAFVLPARLAADIIASNTTLTLTNGDHYFGISIPTPTGIGWNNITFNWIAPNSSPVAFGTLFLLTQEYLGTPAALSSSTPGFLAASTGISSGMYDFAPAVTLLPSTTYWFYSNGAIPSGAITGGAGFDYYSSTATTNFVLANPGTPVALNFTLQGNVVPEPSSLLLFASGLAGLLGAARRKWLA